MVKKLPSVQETQVQSLDWEDPLETGMPAHSNILAWRIPWTEEPGGLQSTESQRVQHSGATNTSLFPVSWFVCRLVGIPSMVFSPRLIL